MVCKSELFTVEIYDKKMFILYYNTFSRLIGRLNDNLFTFNLFKVSYLSWNVYIDIEISIF